MHVALLDPSLRRLEGHFLAAIDRAAADINALKQKAAERAAIWNRDNGIEQLAEQFLALAR